MACACAPSRVAAARAARRQTASPSSLRCGSNDQRGPHHFGPPVLAVPVAGKSDSPEWPQLQSSRELLGVGRAQWPRPPHAARVVASVRAKAGPSLQLRLPTRHPCRARLIAARARARHARQSLPGRRSLHWLCRARASVGPWGHDSSGRPACARPAAGMPWHRKCNLPDHLYRHCLSRGAAGTRRARGAMLHVWCTRLQVARSCAPTASPPRRRCRRRRRTGGRAS
mgnify:CR=1 FL=1